MKAFENIGGGFRRGFNIVATVRNIFLPFPKTGVMFDLDSSDGFEALPPTGPTIRSLNPD